VGAFQPGGRFGASRASLEEPALGRVQQRKTAQRRLFTAVRLVATGAAPELKCTLRSQVQAHNSFVTQS